MSSRWRLGILVLTVVTACRTTPHNQSPTSPIVRPDSVKPRRGDSAIVVGVAALASDSVPPGVLRGVLVDDSTGEPINSAQVTLGKYPVVRGAVTDRLGRFSLAFDDRTIGLLRVRRIGYARPEDSVRLMPNRGYAVVVPLRPQAVRLDDLVVCSSTGHTSATSDKDKPSSMVRVRDALTGLAPAGGATLITVDRTSRDSSSASPAASDSSLWLAGGRNRLGPYTLIVRSAGYYEWRVDGVRGVVNGCGTLAEPRRLFAWLVPK